MLECLLGSWLSSGGCHALTSGSHNVAVLQGLGLDLLTDCIRALNPSHIVSLCSENPNKNVPQGPFWADESLGLDASLGSRPGPAAQEQLAWQPHFMELPGLKEASLAEQDPREPALSTPLSHFALVLAEPNSSHPMPYV